MPKRFIAGAVCPRCGEQDKITVDTDTDLRACVSCGFEDHRPQTADDPAVDIKTRVTRASARLAETTADPVRLLDPSSGSTKDKEN